MLMLILGLGVDTAPLSSAREADEERRRAKGDGMEKNGKEEKR